MAEKHPYLVHVVRITQTDFIFACETEEEAVLIGHHDGIKVTDDQHGRKVWIGAEPITPEQYDELFAANIHRPEALPR